MRQAPRVALALVLAAYLAPLVSQAPLMEDDEGLHAAIAQEMVERGDWIVPRLLGEPFRDKPILYFWLEAASLRLLGDSELAVRLPGTLVALAGAAAVGWLGASLHGRAVGTWAGLGYATMLLPFGVALAPLHDLVMVPLVTVAVGAYWRVRQATTFDAVARWTLVAGAALGASILGKGLTGVGLAGVGVAAWLIWTRTLSWRLAGAASASLLLAAAIAWPWYAAMEQASPGYLAYFFGERHLGGLADDTQRHAGRPVWYYLPIVVAGTWPWGVALWRRLRPADDAERLLWAWLAADVILLSVAGSKLATYLLPALPPVAILAAARLGDGRAASRAALDLAALLTAVAGALAIPAALWWLDWPAIVPWVWAWAVVAPIAYGWARRALPRDDEAPARLLVVIAAALLTVGVAALPPVADRFTAAPLAAEMNAAGALPPRLLIVDEGIGSFVFYLRPELRRSLAADRVARVSRFSLGDEPRTPGTMVAVAADRWPGVLELYDVGGGPADSRGAFVVRPFADFRRK